jgi:hypothetical protein
VHVGGLPQTGTHIPALHSEPQQQSVLFEHEDGFLHAAHDSPAFGHPHPDGQLHVAGSMQVTVLHGWHLPAIHPNPKQHSAPVVHFEGLLQTGTHMPALHSEPQQQSVLFEHERGLVHAAHDLPAPGHPHPDGQLHVAGSMQVTVLHGWHLPAMHPYPEQQSAPVVHFEGLLQTGTHMPALHSKPQQQFESIPQSRGLLQAAHASPAPGHPHPDGQLHARRLVQVTESHG